MVKNQVKKSLAALLAVIMLLSVLPMGNVFAAGDSMANATSISMGRTYSGNITATNAVDYYKINIGSSGRIALTATAEIAWVYYYLYDSNGKTLWSNNISWNSTTKISNVSEAFDLTKGTYYFVVSKDGSSTGSYFFKTDFASAGESFTEVGNGSDNEMASANAITLNTKYNGQIATNDSVDFYKFVLPSSGRINLIASAEIAWITYYIYNANGETIWRNNIGWTSTTKRSSTNQTLDLTKGTYYFVVSKDGSSTGNYFFKLNFASAGESFTETGNGNNNELTSANAISLNTKYNGQIAANDAIDFYKFTLPSTGKVTLIANAEIEYVNYYIYNINGEAVWSSTVGWNSTTKRSSTNEALDLTKGTYYFVVGRNGSRTGNYSFTLSTHTHKYVNVITKATVSSDGEIVNRCSCGSVKSRSVIARASSISLSKTTFTYNGKTQKPSVVVKDRTGKVLKNGTDYTVKYSSGCKNVGQYSVTITFKGKYSGTKTLVFKIVPKGTSISKLKAGKKQFTAKWSAQTTQTTGYELQYSTKSSMSGAKKVTVGKNKTTSSTVKKLKGGKKYYVRVRTYKTVKVNGKSVKLYSSWSKVKNVKTK